MLSPVPTLIDLPGMVHYGMNILYRKTYCVLLKIQRILSMQYPAPILIDFHEMAHYGMNISYRKAHITVFYVKNIKFWLKYK